MDHHDYLAWLSEIDDLSPYQRIATVRLLAGTDGANGRRASHVLRMAHGRRGCSTGARHGDTHRPRQTRPNGSGRRTCDLVAPEGELKKLLP
jgi:hypothetical protein